MWAHGFRVFFTPLSEVLFTFPSRYSCAIGLPVVFSLAGWAPLLPAGFLVSCGTQVPSRSRSRVSRTRLSRPPARGSTRFRYALPSAPRRSYYPRGASPRPGFGLLRFRSPLLAESLLFSFPAGTKMFQFPALAPALPVPGRPGGFPHSDIRGSIRICRSPRLFAACHVLLRLREPQASPMRPYSLSLCFFCQLPLPFRDCGRRFRSLFVSRLLSFRFRFFRVCIMSMDSSVVSGRVELPTSTLSV